MAVTSPWLSRLSKKRVASCGSAPATRLRDARRTMRREASSGRSSTRAPEASVSKAGEISKPAPAPEKKPPTACSHPSRGGV